MRKEPFTLLILFGPAAVGKMTVGQALCARLGYKLFHNHMTIDTLTPVFDFGTPPFATLTLEFRMRVVEEAAKAPLTGLVHTFIWAFEDAFDAAYMQRMRSVVLAQGGRVLYVELQAPWSVRKERALSENRRLHKPGNVARGAEHIEHFEKGLRLSSDGQFPYPDDHLLMENSTQSPEEVAEKIIGHFGLRVAS